jgi:hypothetical protein
MTVVSPLHVERSLCDLSVCCVPVADRYLIKGRFYQAAELVFGRSTNLSYVGPIACALFSNSSFDLTV